MASMALQLRAALSIVLVLVLSDNKCCHCGCSGRVALAAAAPVVAAGVTTDGAAHHANADSGSAQPSSTALVPFSYAGQEIMRVFHTQQRTFHFQDTRRNRLRGESLVVRQR